MLMLLSFAAAPAWSAPLLPAPCPPPPPSGLRQLQVRFPPGILGQYESLPSQDRLSAFALAGPVGDGFGLRGTQYKLDVILPGTVYDAQLQFGNVPLRPGDIFRMVRSTGPIDTWTSDSVVIPQRSASDATRVGWRTLTNTATRLRFEYVASREVPATPSPDFDWVIRADYTCATQPVDRVHPLSYGVSALGTLVGTGDVLKFEFDTNSVPTGPQNWLIWVDTSFNPRQLGFDVDLFAVRSDRPEPLETTARIRQQNQILDGEVVTVGTLPAGAKVTIAIQSRNGSGSFMIRVAPVRHVAPTLRAGFSFPPTEAQIASATRVLGQAQRQWFTMTGGALRIPVIELTPRSSAPAVASCSCQNGPCNICFHNSPGRSIAPLLLWIDMFFQPNPEGELWSPYIMTHELGHHPFGLLDEYADHTENFFLCHADLRCAHSVMGSFELKLCTTRNHALHTWPRNHVSHAGLGGSIANGCDSTPGSIPLPTNTPNPWDQLGLGPIPESDLEVRTAQQPLGNLRGLLRVERMPNIP